MKTDRLTLLISPADKAAINARAELLGISVSELVRKAAMEYDPAEAEARAEVEALLPEFSATVGQIHASFARMIERLDEGERKREAMETDAFRDEVRQQILANPEIDWDRVRALVDGQRKAA